VVDPGHGDDGSGNHDPCIDDRLYQYARTTNIVTIEDPIEFYIEIKEHRTSARSQRYFHSATLWERIASDPDVILGRDEDFETISTALVAAETGHLVLSTFTPWTRRKPSTVSSPFSPYQQKQVRMQLASVIMANHPQRLVAERTATMCAGGRGDARDVVRARGDH
jgi:Tfp pilus assembly pilus retraction ATPase PilT